MPSTVIRTTHYEPETRLLLIVFQTGRRYIYMDVPPEVYAGLKAAYSRGAFFNEKIRDHYAFRSLDDEA